MTNTESISIMLMTHCQMQPEVGVFSVSKKVKKTLMDGGVFRDAMTLNTSAKVL